MKSKPAVGETNESENRGMSISISISGILDHQDFEENKFS